MPTVKQLMDLRGRRALLTGALGGLGRVMANALAELGADLVLVDRPGADFTPLQSELARWQVDVMPLACDLENERDRGAMIKQLMTDGRELSILINNAAFVGTSGLTGWSVPFETQTVETWRRALEVNLTAAFEITQGLAPLLFKSRGANIVNISSIYGFLGPDWRLYEGTSLANPIAYSVSKGGVLQLTRWLATTLAPSIRVNCISPGGVWRNQPVEFVQRYEARTPLRRMAREDDFIGALVLLVSDLGGYITGQNIVVDGGWDSW